jgi:hypothetical protein
LRTVDLRFEAQQRIPDLAADLRHFVDRPQHLLQTAFVQRLYLFRTSGSTLFSINHIDCVWVMAPEKSKMNMP